MSKVPFKLIFIILFTNLIFSQTEKNYLFVGHSYGSPSNLDMKQSSSFLSFVEKNINMIDSYVLGGDMIYDCNSNKEIENFISFINKNRTKFVIGNHDLCDKIINLSNEYFGGENYSELINSNLLLYLNTSLESLNEKNNLYEFIIKNINQYKPKNILLFNHQVIFSKNDFYLRTNSRKYYKYGNQLFDKIYEKYKDSTINFYLFSGDIGAFPLTPYAFYDKQKNFNLYASGLGNGKNNKAILIKLNDEVNIKFIDLDNGKIEPSKKYSKLKVQSYQLPKLLASKAKGLFLKY